MRRNPCRCMYPRACFTSTAFLDVTQPLRFHDIGCGSGEKASKGGPHIHRSSAPLHRSCAVQSRESASVAT